MTNIAWAHLPNAKHIDYILYDVKVRPGTWAAAQVAASHAASHEARDAALVAERAAVWSAIWAAVQDVIFDAVPDAAVNTIWDVITALIAWDSSADLLDCTPDVLRTMIDLAEPPVCHQAALLLPYAIVRSNDK
jgi:hypothetical protein